MLTLQRLSSNLYRIPFLSFQPCQTFYKTSYSSIETQRLQRIFEDCIDPNGSIQINVLSFRYSFSAQKIQDNKQIFAQLTGFDKRGESKGNTLTQFELGDLLRSESLALKAMMLSEAMGLTAQKTVERCVIATIKPFDPY